MKNYRIFISYARSDDEPFVRRLHADLTAAGFTVWLDRESLMSRGLTFHQEIKDAIRTEVDRVVYVGGPKAAQSAYVREEWQFALECDHLVVVPIRRLGDMENVPGELSLLHCEDFRDDANYPAALAKLITSLRHPSAPTLVPLSAAGVESAIAINDVGTPVRLDWPEAPSISRETTSRAEFTPRIRPPRVESGCDSADDRVFGSPGRADLERASAAVSTASKPEYPPENVQFTVFRPRSICRDVWRPMLVYAHLDDGPVDQPTPIEKIREEVARLLRDEAKDYTDVTKDSRSLIPREAEIQFVPMAPGVRFNPPSRQFYWSEGIEMHKEEFQVRADSEAPCTIFTGTLTVYLGVLIIAELPLRFHVTERSERAMPAGEGTLASAKPYRNIFPSYSRRDEEIVHQVEAYARTMGDHFLKDVTLLRAGEQWSPRLMELIQSADVFQLFWSTRSAGSKEVEKEWRHALCQPQPNFIRPTYWEDTIPNIPAEMGHLHFQRLTVAPPGTPIPPKSYLEAKGRTRIIRRPLEDLHGDGVPDVAARNTRINLGDDQGGAPRLMPEARTTLLCRSFGSPAGENARPTDDLPEGPVVGWLVVVEGPGRGKSVTLGYGMNTIGRQAGNRVCLPFGDMRISPTKHAVLTYDPRSRKFFIQHGESSNLTYVGKLPVLSPVELKPGDLIRLGDTTVLKFIPLCGDDFNWD